MAIATSPLALAFQAQRPGRRRRLRKPPPWLHPRQLERTYAAALGRMADAFIRQVREVILPALPSIEEQARSEQGHVDSTRADAWFDRIAPLLEVLQISATQRGQTVKAQAIDIGQKTSNWNDKEWQKILRKTVGVGLLTSEPGLRDRLRMFSTTSEKWFKKMQTDQLANLEGIIERGFAQGLRHTEVAKQIEAKLKTTKSRARLIARDQVSKLNGRLTQMRQEEAGISKYIWQTSEDSRVRATHSPMDGKLGRWDDASVYANPSAPNKWLSKSGIGAVELHPGQDILCRCFAEPFIQELAEEEAA